MQLLDTITDLYKYSPDAVRPIHAVGLISCSPKSPAQDGDKFRSILGTIYNQSQLAERKHVARYWSISTAVAAAPLSAHPSPLAISQRKISGGHIGRGRGGCSEEVFCSVLPLWIRCTQADYLVL